MTLLQGLGADSEKMRTIGKGAFSGIQETMEVVITNQTQWADIWNKHSARKTPVDAPPEVDFQKESVIFVALGQKRTGGYAVEIAGLQRANDKTEIMVKTRAPKPGGFQLQALSAPFHIVVVPKIDGTVKFTTKPMTTKPR